MYLSTFSSREFNQEISKAKREALKGPVFITDRGDPAYVLLSIDEYKKLMGQENNMIELLAMPGSESIEFEAPRLSNTFHRPADFS
jgi:prevent-host-death family protein